MRRVLEIFLIIGFASAVCSAQRKTTQKPPVARATPPAVVPVKEEIVDKGNVSGRTYTNDTLKFSIAFPYTWLIPGYDFEDHMKKQGFDLSLRAPINLVPVERTKLNQSLKRVEILVTAYRSMPGSADNAIMRVAAEDLKAQPQIKDAVDYFDAVRQMYSSMKLPADFKYSETQAEKLGRKQFAYLDVSSKAGKKRMYATVRNGFAILFVLSYSSDGDLQTMRQILADGNFALK